MWAGSRLAGDKPDSLLPQGIEITCQFSQLGGPDPGFDLRRGGSAGGEYDPILVIGEPAGFDPGEGFLVGVRKNTKDQFSRRKAGAIPMNGGLQPNPGGSVVVLRQNLACSGEARPARCQVGAEEQEVVFSHLARNPAEERQRGKIGQHAKEGEKARLRKRGRDRWEADVEIDPSVGLSDPFHPNCRTPGKGKVGVGGMEPSRGG